MATSLPASKSSHTQLLVDTDVRTVLAILSNCKDILMLAGVQYHSGVLIQWTTCSRVILLAS